MIINLNKEKGSALEVCTLGEWKEASYTEYGPIGFDLIVKLGFPLHIVALSIRDNHIAICLLNVTFAYFWRH